MAVSLSVCISLAKNVIFLGIEVSEIVFSSWEMWEAVALTWVDASLLFFYFLPLDDRKYCNIHIYFTRQSETKLRWMYFAFLRNLRAWKTLKIKYIIRYFESKNSFPSLENPIHLNWSMLSFDKGFGIGRAVFYLLPRSKQKGVFQWIWMNTYSFKRLQILD